MDVLAVATGAVSAAQVLATEAGGGEAAGLQINLFWIIVSSLNFLLFLFILWTLALKPVSRMLEARRSRIETGLRDAEQARLAREQADAERLAALQEARREANEILQRAQKIAQETRDADITAAREEVERIKTRATSEIEAEKQHAMQELRAEVANLAIEAAEKVIGESMDDTRQRRIVAEFLRESNARESKT
jgi:F-type H+-transporting ATPase subunit b